MSFDGMDVEQAQSLARQLEGHAQNLGHLTSSRSTLVTVPRPKCGLMSDVDA